MQGWEKGRAYCFRLAAGGWRLAGEKKSEGEIQMRQEESWKKRRSKIDPTTAILYIKVYQKEMRFAKYLVSLLCTKNLDPPNPLQLLNFPPPLQIHHTSTHQHASQTAHFLLFRFCSSLCPPLNRKINNNFIRAHPRLITYISAI